MDIKRSGDRLILNISGKKWLKGLATLSGGIATLVIVLATGFIGDHPFLRNVFITAASFSILYSFYTLASAKMITIDQGNKALDIQSFCLGLCYHSQKVSFSKVEAINMEYRKGEYTSTGHGIYHSPDVWSVLLVFENFKQVKVCSGENENEQMRIAESLSEALGKNVRRTDALPGLLHRIFSGDDNDRRPPSSWDRL